MVNVYYLTPEQFASSGLSYVEAYESRVNVDGPLGLSGGSYFLVWRTPRRMGRTETAAGTPLGDFWRAHRDLADAAWASPPEGLQWYGTYVPVNLTTGLAERGEDGQIVSFSSGHLAAVWIAQRGSICNSHNIICCTDVAGLDSGLIGAGPEVIGARNFGPGCVPLTGFVAIECPRCGALAHEGDCRSMAHRLIGVELEGRWRNVRAVQRQVSADGLTHCGDGSVNCGNTDATPMEIQTCPARLAKTLAQVIKFYPHEADQSCGMHVHVSFNATDISCLATTKFFGYFRDRWAAWGARHNLDPAGEFYRRLTGKNQYCAPNETVNRDLTDMHRYAQLNFSAWHEHRTVECRLLPMFRDASLAVSAIEELINIYEDFLAQPDCVDSYFPEHEATVDVPAQYELKCDGREVEDFAPATVTLPPLAMALEDMAPPAPGMMRVALPGGKIDAARLASIAKLQKDARREISPPARRKRAA